ncbi:hypothetical protein M405DRAFT_768267 [Rhizopogon salebrosus TDB-379]|nr:hypothetical protein M405DRAFT_768267 [Rhizopogon salebrosus TDB-379]
MCNFVVPIRTCSKCQQKEPLFDEKERQFTSVGGKKERKPAYMEPPQDCYSRRCIFSSEHPSACSSCWFTCKKTHGKAREIQGGSHSFVCHSCTSGSQECPPWQSERSVENSVFRPRDTSRFSGFT